MPGENVDRRVKKTKRQLRLALMELMCEKPQKHISVRELAERADINRGTFYIHYKDVSDLLQQLETRWRIACPKCAAFTPEIPRSTLILS